MALPKLDIPLFEVTLPLSKQAIKFRPFLVKEEKILLMAMESDDEKATILAIKQILNNCCQDDVDIENMPVTDLEFLFLNLRARSVGEVVELQYKCNNKVKDEQGNEKTCGHVVQFSTNILEIQPEIPAEHTNKIEISDKMGMVMRYPTFKMMENTKGDETERIMDIVISSIDFIYDEESVYYSKDVSKKELIEFVESMTKEQFEKVQKFFETLPKIKKEIDFKCSKCGYSEHIVVEGIQNFFV